MNGPENHSGTNRTGIQSAPLLSRAMIKSEGLESRESLPDETPEIEKEYLQTAHEIGSVPMPLTFRGLAKVSLEVIKGNSPMFLLNKLGERLAFERSSVRLYEALIRKLKVQGLGAVKIEALERIHDEELQHMFIVNRAIEDLGGDSSALTPGGDVVTVASSGLFQVVTDPRTSVSQALEAVLMAELSDHCSWEMLIQLVQRMGQDDLLRVFRAAEAHESQHVTVIRQMLMDVEATVFSVDGSPLH